MGEEKSARYTIILGVCLLLCLLMLGRMLVGRSESEAPPDGTEPVETVPEEQQEPQLSLVMTMSESDLANFLPQTAAELVTGAMANALNRKLEELNVAPQRLAWSDGEIEIYA